MSKLIPNPLIGVLRGKLGKRGEFPKPEGHRIMSIRIMCFVGERGNRSSDYPVGLLDAARQLLP